MSGKFMSVKRYIIPTITMVIIASQLCGCAAASQSELLQMINRGDQIEIEVAVPISEEQGTEQSILWEQLASLTTNDVLRKEWDNILGIINTDTGKNGIIYINEAGENDNNNTLRMALHNRAFVQYLENESNIESLAEASLNQYADIEAEETMKAVYMGINGYFNLLPDATPNYSNPDSTLSRLEFMSMVMRAETPVQEIESDSAFATAVGSNDLNIYAQEVAESSYLDLASKSLNNMTANGTMTRAEAVYLLIQRYFSDELANVDISSATLSDCKDGGKIAEQQKFIENGVAKDYWKSYELTYTLANPDAGVPTDLYKALCLAQQKGIITSETRFDEGITKVEAVEMLVETLKSESGIEIFNATMGTISGYEVTEKEIESTDKADINNETQDGLTHESEVPAEPTPEPAPELTEAQIKVSEILKSLTPEEIGQLTSEEISALNNGDPSIYERNQAEREAKAEQEAAGQVQEKTDREKADEILNSLTPEEIANLPLNQLTDLLAGNPHSYTGKPTVPSGGSNSTSNDIPSSSGNSGSGATADTDNPADWDSGGLSVPELSPGDGSLPGSM